MIYIPENHIGYDADTIGFPSIKGCHAIVLQTDTGLYGYHAYGGEQKAQATNRATAFNAFVQQHNMGANRKKIFSACFFKKRYYGTGKKDMWRTEIKEYADALGVGTGDIKGYNLSSKVHDKVVNGKTEEESSYVEMRLANGSVTVHYKVWSKMQEQGAPITPPATEYQRIHPNGTLHPATSPSIQPVAVIATPSNKGEIHEFGWLASFSY